MDEQRANRWKGLVLGAIGGMVGALAMQLYWQQVKALLGRDPRTQYDPKTVPATRALDDLSLVGRQYQEGESSTAALGRIVYQRVSKKEPDQETKTVLSYLIHWLISALASGAYGALRTRAGVLDVRGGLALGMVLWLLGDELLMPLLGLTKGPTAYPPELHAHSGGAHVAYGLASSASTQVLQRLL